jgi:hypothetical protein
MSGSQPCPRSRHRCAAGRGPCNDNEKTNHDWATPRDAKQPRHRRPNRPSGLLKTDTGSHASAVSESPREHEGRCRRPHWDVPARRQSQDRTCLGPAYALRRFSTHPSWPCLRRHGGRRSQRCAAAFTCQPLLGRTSESATRMRGGHQRTSASPRTPPLGERWADVPVIFALFAELGSRLERRAPFVTCGRCWRTPRRGSSAPRLAARCCSASMPAATRSSSSGSASSRAAVCPDWVSELSAEIPGTRTTPWTASRRSWTVASPTARQHVTHGRLLLLERLAQSHRPSGDPRGARERIRREKASGSR